MFGGDPATFAQPIEISGKATVNPMQPYLGIGYVYTFSNGLQISADAGALYTGSPKVRLTAPSPVLPTEIAAESASLQSALRGYPLYPSSISASATASSAASNAAHPPAQAARPCRISPHSTMGRPRRSGLRLLRHARWRPLDPQRTPIQIPRRHRRPTLRVRRLRQAHRRSHPHSHLRLALRRGRCQCRKMRLSPAYLIGEILALIFFLACAHAYGARALYTLPAIAGAAAALRSDLKCREVHELSYLLIAAGAVPYAARPSTGARSSSSPARSPSPFSSPTSISCCANACPSFPTPTSSSRSAPPLPQHQFGDPLHGRLALSVIAIAIALKLTDHETNLDDPMTFIPMAPALILAAAIAIPFACYL